MTIRSRALVAVLAAALLLAGCRTGRGSSVAAAGPGALRWQWRPPPPASVGAPAADDDGVVTTYGHHRVVLIGADGRVRWETERLGVRPRAALLLPDVVVAPADNGLVAIDRQAHPARHADREIENARDERKDRAENQ